MVPISINQTRKNAAALGKTRFFTGKPCIRGHIAERMVSNRRCVKCLREDQKEWGELNPEHRRATKLAWDIKNKKWNQKYRKKRWIECRDKMVAASKRWRLKNADHVRYLAKKWKEENKDRVKKRRDEWSKKNRERIKANRRNMKARVRGNKGRHTAKEIAALLIKQKHKCANSKCKKSIVDSYHADHIIPSRLRGSNDIKNIQLLCPFCNQSKSGLHPDEWKKKIGLK